MAPPSASLEGLRGSLRSWSGPSHLPSQRRYLQGYNLSRCNFLASLRPSPRDAARERAPASPSAVPEPRGAARRRCAAPSGAPAAAHRSLASRPELREGRLAAWSRVLRDSETGLINFCPRLPGPAPIDRIAASAQTEDKENACCGSLDFWVTGGKGRGRGGKNWPFQELVPRLVLSL